MSYARLLLTADQDAAHNRVRKATVSNRLFNQPFDLQKRIRRRRCGPQMAKGNDAPHTRRARCCDKVTCAHQFNAFQIARPAPPLGMSEMIDDMNAAYCAE